MVARGVTLGRSWYHERTAAFGWQEAGYGSSETWWEWAGRVMQRNAKAFEVVQGSTEISKPGAYYFLTAFDGNEPIGIAHACPCGCGHIGALWFRGKVKGRPSWEVSGCWPNVTCYPSIGIKKNKKTDQFHWHGYLRNGVFEELR